MCFLPWLLAAGGSVVPIADSPPRLFGRGGVTEWADLRVVGDDKFPAGGKLSLEIPADIGREDWLALGRDISRGRDISSWHLGDWACHGERRWGDLTAAAAALGVRRKTLYNYASVARRIEVSRRRETLSFVHHEAVAQLPPEDGDGLLDHAEAGGWSRETLRDAAREASAEGRLRAENDRLKRELAVAHADARTAQAETARVKRGVKAGITDMVSAIDNGVSRVEALAASPAIKALHGNSRPGLARSIWKAFRRGDGNASVVG